VSNVQILSAKNAQNNGPKLIEILNMTISLMMMMRMINPVQGAGSLVSNMCQPPNSKTF